MEDEDIISMKTDRGVCAKETGAGRGVEPMRLQKKRGN
jgi:hypothetical protein